MAAEVGRVPETKGHMVSEFLREASVLVLVFGLIDPIIFSHTPKLDVADLASLGIRGKWRSLGFWNVDRATLELKVWINTPSLSSPLQPSA